MHYSVGMYQLTGDSLLLCPEYVILPNGVEQALAKCCLTERGYFTTYESSELLFLSENIKRQTG